MTDSESESQHEVVASGALSLRCLLHGHAEWDTSDLPSIESDRICPRCGRQEVIA